MAEIFWFLMMFPISSAIFDVLLFTVSIYLSRPVPSGPQYPSVLSELTSALGLTSLVVARAFHCPGAFLLALTTARDNFKIVFTGEERGQVGRHECVVCQSDIDKKKYM